MLRAASIQKCSSTLHCLHAHHNGFYWSASIRRYIHFFPQHNHLLNGLFNLSNFSSLVHLPPCPSPRSITVLPLGAFNHPLPAAHYPFSRPNILSDRANFADRHHPHHTRTQSMDRLGQCALGLAAHLPARSS